MHSFLPPSSIDVLYDYIPLLNDKSLCKLPKELWGTKVAVIGAGASGLLAAHELLKMGAMPVIYEATNRIGGRLHTKIFESVEDSFQPFAELGAMRIPRSSHIFFHYAKKMGMASDLPFKGPGLVDTALFYKNKVSLWKVNEPLPFPFKEIELLWKSFLEFVINEIHHEWQKGNLEAVREIWQKQLDRYKDKSTFEVLKEISPFKTNEQISIFGALGFGGGGFSSLFNLGFIEIMRLMANRYFENLIIFPNGLSEFVQKLYHLPANSECYQGSLADHQCVKLNSPVVYLDYNLETRNPIINYKDENNIIHSEEYKAVIFTGTVSAAQLINIAGVTKSKVYLFDEEVRQSIKHSSLMPSSKTFICTKNKFWKEHNFPQCYLTDDLPRAVYFLDYPNTERGVVCMSYTWGSDSLKLHAVDPHDRIVMFRRVMKEISEPINKFLEPLNNEVISIDWVNKKYQNGTFYTFSAGADRERKQLYYQYQSCLTHEDKGVYLSGDTVSWSTGWTEGALYTGLNAVFAVAKRLGAEIPKGSPLEQKSDIYLY